MTDEGGREALGVHFQIEGTIQFKHVSFLTIQYEKCRADRSPTKKSCVVAKKRNPTVLRLLHPIGH